MPSFGGADGLCLGRRTMLVKGAVKKNCTNSHKKIFVAVGAIFFHRPLAGANNKGALKKNCTISHKKKKVFFFCGCWCKFSSKPPLPTHWRGTCTHTLVPPKFLRKTETGKDRRPLSLHSELSQLLHSTRGSGTKNPPPPNSTLVTLTFKKRKYFRTSPLRRQTSCRCHFKILEVWGEVEECTKT